MDWYFLGFILTVLVSLAGSGTTIVTAIKMKRRTEETHTKTTETIQTVIAGVTSDLLDETHKRSYDLGHLTGRQDEQARAADQAEQLRIRNRVDRS